MDGGARASDAGAALLERVSAPVDVTLRVQDLMTVNSFVMTPEDMRAVVVGVLAALQDPTVSGVVVTHGTDTMEETAVLAARGTRKTATVAAAAFTNPESGALGVVVDGRLRLQTLAPVRAQLVSAGSVLVRTWSRCCPALRARQTVRVCPSTPNRSTSRDAG